jgi:hypothetical protein
VERDRQKPADRQLYAVPPQLGVGGARLAQGRTGNPIMCPAKPMPWRTAAST